MTSFVKSQFEQFDKKWLSMPNNCYKLVQNPGTMKIVRILSQGNVAQQKLLVIPDYGAPIDFYAPFLRSVETCFYVATMDLAGQGQSEPSKNNEYTMEYFTQQFTFLIDYLNWSNARFHVVGHGFGATIAAKLAQEPELKRNILSLTLVAPTFIQFNPYPVEPQKPPKSGCFNLCAAPVQQLNLNADFHQRVFSQFSDELNAFLKTAFIEQLNEDFVQRHIFFMTKFKFPQPEILQQLNEITQLKIYLVEKDAHTNAELTQEKLKENKIDSEMIKDTRHEMLTLNPSIVGDYLKGFVTVVEMAKMEPEW
ncbi:Alpha/beta_hydrolase family protein [Hexamita inflata]|uniref:Alpha/beta hydrolase family protein n=1 Tax=Hexamita inflata TaxID=28002 RepID=A0AA86NTB2_9EUKA|nr:Alpha/beta hydrolase family protein [Hexamita inflata]